MKTRALFAEPATDPQSGWATFDDLESATATAVAIIDQAAAEDLIGFELFYAAEHHPWTTPAPAEVA